MANMSDDDTSKVWDEYDWERFLQEQELRTERYMELLEKYMDDPCRDEIIAREMQWTHLMDSDAREWEAEVDAKFHEELVEFPATTRSDDLEENLVMSYEKNPVYQKALCFAIELPELLAGLPSHVMEHPANVALRSDSSCVSAKLAAALTDDEVEEIGMSIAYLKRGLFIVNQCMNSLAQLWAGEMLEAERHETIRSRIYEVRDGIVGAMGSLRAEFRKRHGR